MDNPISNKPNKRVIGEWGVQEFAVAGAPCSKMEQWVRQVLFPSLLVKSKVYVDEDHHPSEWKVNGDALRISGERLEWNTRTPHMPLQYALAVVNGHHFQAQHYVLFTDVAKAASVQKRDAHIRHIIAVVLSENETEVPAHIRALAAWNEKVLVVQHHEIERLSNHISTSFLKIPQVKAVVLTGGKSMRMGQDKALIPYRHTPHYVFVLNQLVQAGMQPHLSVGSGNAAMYPTEYPVLEDAFSGCGPMSGILTAFRHDPESAWCVVACDLPQIDSRAFATLLQKRDPWSDATAFFNEEKQWNEPLCAIWEPRMYVKALQQLALGKTCPRKLMQTQAQVNSLHDFEKRWVANANTPEERDRWLKS